MNQEQQQSQLKQLIAKGKAQGYVTYAEVNDHLPSDIIDPEQIDDIIAMFNDMGIQVLETAPDDDDSPITSDVAISADDDEEVAEVAALASVDSEFGRTTDPVRLYMREMGSVELLTREEELKIAKRIEEGQRQVVDAIARSGFIVQSFVETFDQLQNEEAGLRLSDLVLGFVDLTEMAEELVADDLDDAAPVEEAEDEEAEVVGYDEVKLKVDLIRKALKSANSAIKKHGYGHEKAEKALEAVSEVFSELKWSPQYLKRMVSISEDLIVAIRDQEKIILDICVKKAKIPRKDFINAFTENEASNEWLDQYLESHPQYKDAVA
ncbi:MAG: polymerase sigma factor RpoD, partial [Pseudomonadota bacterium]